MSEKSIEHTRIAVILIAHDRKDFILRAIDSINNQIKRPDEVIIVKSFQDETIDKSIEENNFINIFTSLVAEGDKIGEALKQTTADVICFLEDDDQFLPNKIERIWNLFQNNKVLYVHNNFTLIDDEMKHMDFNLANNIKISRNDGTSNLTGKLAVVRHLMEKGLAFNLSSISVKRELLEQGFLKQVHTGVDEMIFVKSIENGLIIHTGEELTVYRYHHHKARNSQESEIEYLKWIEKFLGSLISFLDNNNTKLANSWARSRVRRLKGKRKIVLIKRFISRHRRTNTAS